MEEGNVKICHEDLRNSRFPVSYPSQLCNERVTTD